MNIILCFHEVKNIEWFENLIVLLKKKFKMISIWELEQFYKGKLPLHKTCHITVDDGELSFYNNIFPILKKHHVPATLFVSPLICRDASNFWFQDLDDLNEETLIKQVNKLNIFPEKSIRNGVDVKWALKCLPIRVILNVINDTRLLHPQRSGPRNINLSQLLEIAEYELIEIGAHTLNHPILSNEDDKTSNYEISESIHLLESILRQKIHFFAYPNGIPGIDFNRREINFLRKNGIKLAFSTEPKILSRKSNPLSIPRLSISYGNISFIIIKIFLFRYWNSISLLWRPGYRWRKKFIELSRVSINKGLQDENYI